MGCSVRPLLLALAAAEPRRLLVVDFGRSARTDYGLAAALRHRNLREVFPDVDYLDIEAELGGAELENQPTSSGVCLGSHWEQRLFTNEVMASTSSHASIFSALTRASHAMPRSPRIPCSVHRSSGCVVRAAGALVQRAGILY